MSDVCVTDQRRKQILEAAERVSKLYDGIAYDWLILMMRFATGELRRGNRRFWPQPGQMVRSWKTYQRSRLGDQAPHAARAIRDVALPLGFQPNKKYPNEFKRDIKTAVELLGVLAEFNAARDVADKIAEVELGSTSDFSSTLRKQTQSLEQRLKAVEEELDGIEPADTRSKTTLTQAKRKLSTMRTEVSNLGANSPSLDAFKAELEDAGVVLPKTTSDPSGKAALKQALAKMIMEALSKSFVSDVGNKSLLALACKTQARIVRPPVRRKDTDDDEDDDDLPSDNDAFRRTLAPKLGKTTLVPQVAAEFAEDDF